MELKLMDILYAFRDRMTEKDFIDLVKFSLDYCTKSDTIFEIEKLAKQGAKIERAW
jgi:hypothetical protein